LKSSVLFCLVLSLFVGPAQAENYDLYILAGQSNMDGRGAVSDLPNALKTAQPDARIYYANPSDGGATTRSGWTNLAPGYSIAPGGSTIPSNTFGPEVSFAGAMAQAKPTGNKIALIKVSKGGTNLHSDWSPTGFMYQALVGEVDLAMQALADNGDSATIRGMIWHQGESDTGDLLNYQANLEELITNIRGTLNDAALPFVIGELGQAKPAAFRSLQQTIASENAGVGFANSLGLNTPDNTHFDAAGQVLMGQRYAEQMAILTPEPGSLILLSVGGLMLIRRQRTHG